MKHGSIRARGDLGEPPAGVEWARLRESVDTIQNPARGRPADRKGNAMRLLVLLGLPVLLAAAQPVTRDMSLASADGFTLRGTLTIPAQAGPRPVVVLAHQFRTDRSGWQPLVDRLNAKGIATLALDLRGHGQSIRNSGQDITVTEDFLASAKAVGFDQIPADLAQAAAWVRRQPRIDPRRLALAGASVGAFAALLAAPAAHPVAVLALSPAGNGGFGAAADGLPRAVTQARAAVLVLAAQDDPEAAANAAALQELPGVYARVVPGADHGFAFLPDASELMAGWLGEYLGQRAPAKAKAPAPAAPPA